MIKNLLKNLKLFTPGPMSISPRVKNVMKYDLPSRDVYFENICKEIRTNLKNIAFPKDINNKYSCVLLQGSGTFGVESVLNSTLSPNDKLLAISNGSYGDRIYDISKKLNKNSVLIKFQNTQPIDIDDIEAVLKNYDNITHISVVHHETSSGQLNDIKKISELCKKYEKKLIIDSISAFGGINMDFEDLDCDFFITNSNKCLHGSPGISIIFGKKNSILNSKYSNSTCLDLYSQYINLEEKNQFIFTPPTHTLLSLYESIQELNEESVEQRENKYIKFNKKIREEMENIGFKSLLPKDINSHFINTFILPDNIKFEELYNYLKDNNIVIYPGKIDNIETFRISNIGYINENDIDNLIKYIKSFIKINE